jgi:hypothetical protein
MELVNEKLVLLRGSMKLIIEVVIAMRRKISKGHK